MKMNSGFSLGFTFWYFWDDFLP